MKVVEKIIHKPFVPHASYVPYTSSYVYPRGPYSYLSHTPSKE